MDTCIPEVIPEVTKPSWGLGRGRAHKSSRLIPLRACKEWEIWKYMSLFVFSKNGPNQNARSLLTPLFLAQLFMLFHMVASMAAPISAYFKDSDWLLEEFWPLRKWFKKLPWRAKPRPYVKEYRKLYQKQVSKVKVSEEKTNSGGWYRQCPSSVFKYVFEAHLCIQTDPS